MQAKVLLTAAACAALLCGLEQQANAESFGCLTQTDCTKNYTATMLGSSVVPPTSSSANGQIDMSFHRIALENTQAAYTIKVANLGGIKSVELHQAPAGQKGDLVAVLYGPVDIDGSEVMSGTLTQGSLTGDQLQGPQQGKGINALQNQMGNSNIYVLVTTAANPSGEIRGQVMQKS